jgi:plasmid stabilization system protein ParE
LKRIRSWRVDGFENYLIFYRFAEMRLEILRIKHGAMDFPRALRRDY